MAAEQTPGYDLLRFNERQFLPPRDEMQRRLEAHPFKDEIFQYLKQYNVPVEVVLLWSERGGVVLSDLGILRHMIAGNIIIYPFNPRQLSTNSYDVTLGEDYYRLEENSRAPARFRTPRRQSLVHDAYRDRKFHTFAPLPGDLGEEIPEILVYNPLDQTDIESDWIKCEAESALVVQERYGIHLKGALPDDKVILLRPHEMILAHTREFIGAGNIVTTTISGRSTSGRNLLEICSDAFSGDIGFINRWTMEIKNKAGMVAVPLFVGERYAQIIFSESGIPAKAYGRNNNSSYQKGQTIEEVIKNWRPEMMLPRMRRLKKQ